MTTKYRMTKKSTFYLILAQMDWCTSETSYLVAQYIGTEKLKVSGFQISHFQGELTSQFMSQVKILIFHVRRVSQKLKNTIEVSPRRTVKRRY